jgi:hypothetical protein
LAHFHFGFHRFRAAAAAAPAGAGNVLRFLRIALRIETMFLFHYRIFKCIWVQSNSSMLRLVGFALLCAMSCQFFAVCCAGGLGRMDSALLFKADAAAYGTAFGPHVRVATTTIDSRLLPTSVTVQAWVMPLPRDDGQIFGGQNDLGQVLGNMARTFSPSRIFAGYSIYCKDSSVNEFTCSFFVATSTTAFIEPSCRVPLRSWTHVTGVYDATTGIADVFVNGSKCASATNAGGAASISYFLRSSFLVGAWFEDAPGTSHASYVTHHTPAITHHTSHVTRLTVTRHTQLHNIATTSLPP